MIWFCGYIAIGLAFALAASVNFEKIQGKDMNFVQWCFCVLLWPILLLAGWFSSMMS